MVNEFFGREAFRFVFVQQVVAELGETAIEVPTDAGICIFQPDKGQGENRGGDQGAQLAVIASDGISGGGAGVLKPGRQGGRHTAAA